MLISVVVPEKRVQRTPKLIDTLLTHLENLTLELGKLKVLHAFYDLDNSEYYQDLWGNQHEKKLQSTKEMINNQTFNVSKQSDVRILVQVFLDFLDSLVEPAVSSGTVAQVIGFVRKGMSAQEILDQSPSRSSVLPEPVHPKQVF